ncbi:MAG: ferrous iron transporter B [Gammaproteobacteria bacterium]|nr:ferrous iron transporter B [Gammaproteobacteria bacterium]
MSDDDSNEKMLLEEEINELTTGMEYERISQSYLGRMGRFMEPAIRPLGFEWRIGVALLSGVVAKEIVASTLGVLYQSGSDETGSENLQKALHHSTLTPLHAYALMAFVLIYLPCLGTIAAIRRETNSWKWTAFSMGYSTALAWIVAFTIVHAGKLLGFA